MANAPVPYVVATSGAAATAPHGAIPIKLYGAVDPAALTFATLAGTVPGVTGTDLQAILQAIVTRLAAVETP